jgi:type I restriction enzyme S subunit
MKDNLKLPKDWEIKTIGDVCVCASSNVSQNKLADDEGDFPIYGASGLIKKVSFYHQDKPYLSIVKDGSGVGRVTKMDAFTSVIGTLQYILPKENIDLDYLYYFLMSVDFKKYIAGAAIPHIYFKDYKNEPFLWMPLPEQKRIVSILDECFAAIDKAKANAEQNLKNTKELFESYLQELFKKKREGWEVKKLNEFCEFINGLWTGKKPPFQTVGVIRNTNFTKDCQLDYSDIVYLEVEQSQFQKRKLQYGDIILEKSGGGPKQPVGRVVIFDKVEGDFSFSNFTSVIRIRNKDDVDFNFLHRYLFYEYISGATEKMQSHSTGIRNLKFDDYKEIEIPLPPLPEQKQIVRQLDALRAETQKLEVVYQKKIADLEELKKSILQKAFSGQLKTEKTLVI